MNNKCSVCEMEMKKIYLICFIYISGLGMLSGCGTAPDENDTLQTSNDSIEAYFDSITGDMLDACSSMPETVEAFHNDALILLNWYREDIRLYGINVGEENKDEATLLYIQGEKVLLSYPYRNLYQEPPAVNVLDVDGDGEEEIVIRRRNGTGSPGCWFMLLVVDQEDEWVVHEYDQAVADMEALIEYEYQEDLNTLTFRNRGTGELLAEVQLPDWTEKYPYTGEVEYGNSIRHSIPKWRI